MRGSRSLGALWVLQTAGRENLSICTGSPTWQVVEPLGALGVGRVANKTAPAVTRETGRSWEKGEEVGPEDNCLVHRDIPGPFSGEKSWAAKARHQRD